MTNASMGDLSVTGRQQGFTRASALGPIADFLDHQGGSITRVMNDVDVPLAILDNPDTLVPLKEQFRVLERAARDIGDPHFGARLGRNVRIANLSAFGKWVSEAISVRDAIGRSNRGLNLYLQTGTNLKLVDTGTTALWSIEFLDPGSDGKYQNELLGLSYLIDVVRCFTGPNWTPDAVYTTCDPNRPSGVLEQIFRTNVRSGQAVPTIVFASALLDVGRRAADGNPPNRSLETGAIQSPVPEAHGEYEAIAAVTFLALLEGYPRVDWVAAKLGLTRRSLQRRLARHGTSFTDLVSKLLRERSEGLLTNSPDTVTSIAMSLGYTDAAHFSRAFKRWTGTSPSAFRNRLGSP